MAGMRYQPQGRAIAGSTGLARGLKFAGVPKVLNAPQIPVKTSPSLSRGGALAFTTPGATSYNLPIKSITSSEWTVACLVFSVADNYAAAFELYGSGASRISLMLWGQFGTLECDARPYSADFGGNRITVPKNTPVILGSIVSGSANLMRTFIDRTECGATTLASTAPITVNQINLFGKDGGGGDRASAGNQILLMVAWDRALSTAEWGQFVSNPWQVLDDQVDDELLQLSAPSSYTLTTESGNFALTGSAASIRASRKLAGGNGSFTLTGNAATLRAGRKVSGAMGVITLTGSAAGLAASRKVAAAPGAFAVAGAAASIRVGRAVAASTGAFAVAGQPAALRASRRITGAPAALALTGSDARLSVARRLAAAAGAFTLTGGAAQLVYSPVVEGNVLFTETGQFVLTGSAVGMRVTRRLQAAPGSFALAGGSSTIRCALRIAGDPAAFVVAGGAAVLRAAWRLSLASGAFGLVGSPALLAYSSTIEYTRAPAGSGYTPQRNEYQSRPAQAGGARPPAVEKAYR